MELGVRLEQNQILAPRMEQSVRILQKTAETPVLRAFFDKAGLLVYNAKQSITCVKSARGKESVQWKKRDSN